MDAFSAGFDITTARFIFSQDWLLLAGSFGKHGCLQIRANEFVNGVDGNSRFEVKSNYLVDGMITCVESCTIERLGKNVIVVGGVRANDCSGFLEIVNLRIQGGKVDLTPNDSFDFLPTVLHGIANITGIVFRPDREILILSTEGGEIIILDLYLGKILYREMIDATGIVKIQMSVTGQLVTLGRSSSAPIKVWDLRFSEAVEVLTLALQLEIPLHSPLKATASFREPLTSVLSSSRKAKSNNNMNANIEDLSRRTDVQRTALQAAITCFTVHPTQDRIFLGNTTGAVILWDLRMNSTVAFQAHSSRVNAIVVHPEDVSQVISAATDGTVNQINTRKIPISSVSSHNNSHHNNVHKLLTDSDVLPIFQREVAMLGLDCDASSRQLLVTCEFGEMFRFSLR